MSKLILDSSVPDGYEKSTLSRIIRTICGQINLLSEGRISAKYNAQVSAPAGTAAAYNTGDFVPNSNVTVGSSVAPGSGLNYITLGWLCTAPGSPGTQQEVRVLTGGGSVYQAVNPAQQTTSLGSDVALNNTANYFDGPSLNVGTVGTWFVSGTVVVSAPGASDNFALKLWDGTTVIASAHHTSDNTTTSDPEAVAISGVITNPAGNLRISVKDVNSTSGKILFNASGNSKDSTITAIRIA